MADLSASSDTYSVDSEVMKQFELKSNMSNLHIGITTNDVVIKRIFRALLEPIILFGEGNYERRERLKKLLLSKYDEHFRGKEVELAVSSSAEANNFFEVLRMFNIDMSNLFSKKGRFADFTPFQYDNSETGDRELFYTEGDDSVKHFRTSLAHYAWSRNVKRKMLLHKFRASCDQYEHKDEVENYGNFLTENLSLAFAQLAATRPLTMAKFSPNARYLASSSYNGEISVFDCNDSKYKQVVRLASDSSEMVHCFDWNYNSSHVCYDRTHPTSIADNDLLLVSGGSGGSLTLWKPFSKIKDEEFEMRQHTSRCHESRVNRVVFHPCNNLVASSSADETVVLFDLEKLSELYVQEGHSHSVYGLAINGDGNLIASGDAHGVLLVFDLRTGRHIFQQVVHNADVTGVSFHPLLSHIFATSSSDNSVKIFDLRKFRPITSLLTHTKVVSDLQFEPVYGRFLATSSFDTHVKIWDTSVYKCRKVLTNDDTRVMGVHVSPDATAIVSAGYDRTWRLFKPNSEYKDDSSLYRLLN
ncbi:U4/U6 small nuclear ribonucleoprotein [Theileria orientalis strain Shintoku]|uniref:U4/U6 small nuclear ribonucleoprotein n=1 Tax=Theileria orientalis strain Shintoku TaxID=869250 RepID=J4D5H0_THEOR|nr:U4/U6 small nuclear ribonucleoprotein [Theileria orientalis strain Shintoku]PVC53180.1 U4/U6 small nuclear ribonucleoprotein [Theileria orientalis]BAM38960.1 U4/U6 small nuclear ribonucleoprotein [Theileria orientalis strain Shintoku]|eukprot:XP_009689261.1 U4/U6 small nuclear ribonucleoprotein [Theileria orientalis strain Shintoku]